MAATSVEPVNAPTYSWRGVFSNEEVHALHAEAFETRLYDESEWDWVELCRRHSLGWVAARMEHQLIGFANVLWDGLVHAFLEDVMVAAHARHRGVGVGLIRTASDGARPSGLRVPPRRLRAGFATVLHRGVRVQRGRRRPHAPRFGLSLSPRCACKEPSTGVEPRLLHRALFTTGSDEDVEAPYPCVVSDAGKSPRVGDNGWGHIEVVGYGDFRDVKLWPGGAREWDWNETDTRHDPGIQPADLDELLAFDPDVVVLSRGRDLRLKARPETVALLEQHEVELVHAETSMAISRYNTLVESGRRVAALLHSTC